MKAYKLFLVLMLLCTAHLAAAQQVNEAEQAEQTGQAEQRTGVLQFGSKYINSLLRDKEIPLIGGHWSGELMVDAPLNGEPQDARVILRRAKLRYGRALGEHWLIKLTSNYTKGGGLEIADTYIVYSGWKTALLTFGVFDPPFSLESMSTSSSLTFMERSMVIDALSERQSGGLSFLKRTPNHIFNGMLVFLNPADDDLRQSGEAIIGHYVYSPVALESANNVHIGGSFSFRQNTSGNRTQFRSRPEVATTEDYFVDTGTIDGADKVLRLGFEASKVAGRFSWQTEVLTTRVTRTDKATAFFWGGYVYASWFLTNDSRNYDLGTGKYDIVTPSAPVRHGGWGAFEVAARASYVDLTNKNLIGGTEKNISLGVNWYLNEKLRVMTNLTKVLDVNRPGSEFDNQSPLILSVRAQWVLY